MARVRVAWWTVAAVAAFVSFGRAAPAEAQCYICAKANTEVNLSCGRTSDDGYVECTSNSEYCAGVLPRCFGSFSALDADGSVRLNPDSMVQGDAALQPGTAFSSPMEATGMVLRRPCDGVVLSRRYPAELATNLRQATEHLTI